MPERPSHRVSGPPPPADPPVSTPASPVVWTLLLAPDCTSSSLLPGLCRRCSLCLARSSQTSASLARLTSQQLSELLPTHPAFRGANPKP